MNKERTAINLNSVVIFSGDITDENLKIIPKNFSGDIVVHGDMKLARNWNIPCSLWVLGDIDSYAINVAGDIYCKGDFNSCDINVAGDFFCGRNIDSCVTNVAGDFHCEGDVECTGIDVGGEFIASKINAHNHAINAKSLKCHHIERAILIKIG